MVSQNSFDIVPCSDKASATIVALLINQASNCQLAFNAGNLFSSPAPLDVFVTLQGFIANSAPVLPVVVLAPTSASVAICTNHFTVVLALGAGVPISKSSHCAVPELYP